MNAPFQPCGCPARCAIIGMLAAALLFPGHVRAECKEFKIVEYEDRVEAVCVGEPMTEAQKKTSLEEERRQEQEAQRQRIEDLRRQKEAERVERARAEAEAAGERKRRNQPPIAPQAPATGTTHTNPQILFK